MMMALAVLLTLRHTPQQPPAIRVLFIGNSLTTANDLPGMIEAVAASAGLAGRITCRTVAYGDFGLPEHWTQGDARREIQRGGWTHIVVQQGPSSLPESRVLLREYAQKFAANARARGARIVLYGVWPPRSRLDVIDAVTGSYAAAAADVGGSLVPVGDAWRAAWTRMPSLQLYGPDEFHPSPIGTYLGALMFFEHLTGRPPGDVPNPTGSRERALRSLRITADEFAVLKAAASDANARAALALSGR